MQDLSQPTWRKASRSVHDGACVEVAAVWRKASASAHSGGCVEVAGNLPGTVALRDSKTPQAGAHVISRAAFAAFLGDAKAGRFDL